MQFKHTHLYYILFIVIFLQSCVTSYKYSYEEENLPSFKGDYRYLPNSPDTTTLMTKIMVVSFNIEFSENIEGAIALLQEEPLNSADVILLQEMDEEGTEEIAKYLCMNYTYYPAIYHPKHEKNVGNAILTKWKIKKCEKVKLPHPSTYPVPFEGINYIFRKTATVAEIEIHGDVIKFASTHAAAFNTTLKRKEFAEAIADEFNDSKIDLAVVGGDFNSLGSADIDATTTSFTTTGFQWVSKNLGITVSTKKPILQAIPSSAFQLDHLFVKGMQVHDMGKVDQEGVSDHLPIWVELEINKHITASKTAVAK